MALIPGDPDLEIFLKGMGLMPTSDPSNFIPLSPENRTLPQTPQEQITAQGLGVNPFSMGHNVGERLRRNAAEKRQQFATAQDTVTATNLATADKQWEQVKTFLENAPELGKEYGLGTGLQMLNAAGLPYDEEGAMRLQGLEEGLLQSQTNENNASAFKSRFGGSGSGGVKIEWYAIDKKTGAWIKVKGDSIDDVYRQLSSAGIEVEGNPTTDPPPEAVIGSKELPRTVNEPAKSGVALSEEEEIAVDTAMTEYASRGWMPTGNKSRDANNNLVIEITNGKGAVKDVTFGK